MKRFVWYLCGFLAVFLTVLFIGKLSYLIYYHEQHQLFLFDSNYWRAYAGVPGKPAEYAASFFIQFFFYPGLGSFVLALLFTGVYFVGNKCVQRIYGRSELLSLSLLPLVYLLLKSLVVEYSMAILVAVLVNQLFFLIYLMIPRIWRLYYTVPVLFLLYWVCGSYAVLFIFLAVCSNILYGKRDARTGIELAVLFILLASLPYAGSYFFRIPLHKAMSALLPDDPGSEWILPLLLLLPLFAERFTSLLKKGRNVTAAIALVVIAGGSTYLFIRQYDVRVKMVLDADREAKARNWDAVLDIARRYEGSNQLMSYLSNLALYHTGKMPEKLFLIPQHTGVNGLFFFWDNSSRKSEYGDMAYADLGLINEAHRWAFEAMVVFGETAPLIQKLVIYNAANDRPLVEERFRNVLRSSLFYKNWADTFDLKRSNPTMHVVPYTDSIPLYFHQNVGPDLMWLCDAEPGNRMAFEYLMSYFLLSNRVVKFTENLYRIENFSYKSLPKIYDEALMIYKLGASKEQNEALGWSVSPETESRFKSYYQDYMARMGMDRDGSMKRKYGDTYWYYLHFSSPYGRKVIEK